MNVETHRRNNSLNVVIHSQECVTWCSGAAVNVMSHRGNSSLNGVINSQEGEISSVEELL